MSPQTPVVPCFINLKILSSRWVAELGNCISSKRLTVQNLWSLEFGIFVHFQLNLILVLQEHVLFLLLSFMNLLMKGIYIQHCFYKFFMGHNENMWPQGFTKCEVIQDKYLDDVTCILGRKIIRGCFFNEIISLLSSFVSHTFHHIFFVS